MTPQNPSDQGIIAPGGLTPPDQAPTSPATGWAAVAQDLPKDISDTGYKAIREKYFYEHMAGPVLQQGASLSLAKDHFMAATERQKAEYPRLELTAAEAGASLTAPVSAMSPIGRSREIQRSIDERAAEAGKEAMRQGISPIPYALAGGLIGTAPYFMAGEAGFQGIAGEAILKGLAGGGRVLTEGGKEVLTKEGAAALETYQKSLIGKATHAGAIGLLSGAYDAAVAPEGQGLGAFAKGAAIGGGIAAGLEGLGSLAGFLRARHGLDVDSAKAVEAVAKGGGTPKDEALATRAVLKTTDLDKSIGDFVGQQKAASAKQGVPGDVTLDSTPTGDPKPPVYTPSGRVRIQMLGADGKTYHLGGAVGLKADQLNQINSRVVEHLNAGGSIQAINGDPALINQTLTKLAELNPDAFSLSNPIRPSDPANPPAIPARVKATVVGGDPVVRASRKAATGDDIINAKDNLYHSTDWFSALQIAQEGIKPSGAYDLTHTARIPMTDPIAANSHNLPVTFVIDNSKVRSEPWVNPDMLGASDKTVDEGGMNRGFEFESTVSKPTPLDAIKGIIVNKSRISAQELKDGLAELRKVTKLPIKVMEEEDIKSYRAGLSQQPPKMRFAASPRSFNEISRPQDTSWVSPEGEVHTLDSLGVTEHVAAVPLLSDITTKKLPDKALRNQGWAQVRENGFTVKDWDSPSIPAATFEAKNYAERAGESEIYVGDHKDNGAAIPLGDIGEFLANPKKYIQRVNRPQGRFAVSPSDRVPAHDQTGTWVSPNGDSYDIGLTEHAFARPIPEASIKNGWIRTRGDAITVNSVEHPGLAKLLLENKRDWYLNTPAGLGLQIPKEDIGEFLANPTKYARRNADELPRSGARFAVGPGDIPDYDKYMQLPSGKLLNRETWEVIDPNDPIPSPKPEVYGIVRGSSDIPLSLKGQAQTKALGERIAAKGGLDELHMADLKRYRQTADNIMAGDKAVVPQMPNPMLRSRGLGDLEGMEQTPQLMTQINRTVDYPDFRPIGMGPRSTMQGESLNEFKARILPQMRQRMFDSLYNPEKKIGIVTSSQDIGLVKAWLAKKSIGKGDIDPEVLKSSYENPGSVYRLAPEGKGWNIRAVDMDADAPLKGGIYMIRHGETPWNKSAREMEIKDRPLARRGAGSSPMLGDGTNGVAIEWPGQQSKPTLMYRDTVDKGTVFHENLHGHFGALDMHDYVKGVMDDPMADKIFHAGFAPVAKDLYGDDPSVWREEVYVHGADAIRTGNAAKIDSFARADDGKEHWLDWMTQKTDELREEAAMRDDSLHKRTLERRLGAVQSRATNSLEDIRRTNSQAGLTPDFDHGQYVLREGDKATLYPSREEMLQDLESRGEPLNAPELVPLDRLPEGVPRYSRGVRPMSSGERPNVTNPPSPDVQGSGPRQARGGLQLASRFFRPFNGWVATVAQKNQWPELYEAFAPLDRAQVEFNNTVRPYYKILKSTLGQLTEQRQKDFMTWFRNPADDFVKSELHITPEEEKTMQAVKATVLDPLESRWGTSLEDWRDRVLPKDNFLSVREARGSLDPKEDNFSKLVAKYLEFGAWNEHIKPGVDAAEKVAQQRLEGGGMRAGNLLPLLQRHIDYLRGQPDYTQEIIQGAIEGSLHLINQGFEKLGIDYRMKEISEDPLGKYTLFMYAGALAMKPATIIRDGLQLMLTTFPVAGKYTFRGIEKAFGAFDKAKRADLWDIPQKYGALIERADLRSLYDGSTGGEEVGSSRGKSLMKGAEAAANFGMKSIQLTHNGNRLAAFWGHSEQVLDALDAFRATGDQQRFIRDSGLWFMPKPQQDSFLKEIPDLKKGDATNDFSYRASKELVELSQWNFKRGANPGLYEYQLGRLFGQYGTWPLNYIEYARRLATAGDGKAQRDALIRLTLAHGAVLAAGQSMGVDTGRWVFTGPMAYEGGPLFNALTSLPSAAAPGEEGREARENLLGAIPGVDRVLDLKSAFMDATSGEPGGYMRLLGFHAMHPSDYGKGLHQFLPKEEE